MCETPWLCPVVHVAKRLSCSMTPQEFGQECGAFWYSKHRLHVPQHMHRKLLAENSVACSSAKNLAPNRETTKKNISTPRTTCTGCAKLPTINHG